MGVGAEFSEVHRNICAEIQYMTCILELLVQGSGQGGDIKCLLDAKRATLDSAERLRGIASRIG